MQPYATANARQKLARLIILAQEWRKTLDVNTSHKRYLCTCGRAHALTHTHVRIYRCISRRALAESMTLSKEFQTELENESTNELADVFLFILQ